ncbi:GntR family transcriptional regulator [Tsukamurella sputi]|uniref:GntR family transcriptional regulator n=1 Tax=Tsukamurella sputi TaxID=2591848 RepID=A0A5C5RN54_9ACTN|nr:GntR family transcriptional regulator [Tsukamurella sputi]
MYVSKSQRAYEALRERIADGTYGPGHRLVLDRLARESEISVVPVREAVRRLEAEGLVTFEPNVGARVARIDPRKYHDITETMSIVEGAAVALAAPLLTTADLSAARAINEQLRHGLDDFDPVRFTAQNEDFHRVLSAACPNGDLRDAVDRCWRRLSHVRSTTFAFVPGRANASVLEHERILLMIERGEEPRAVELAVRAHRLATPTAYLHRPVPGRAPHPPRSTA